MVARSLETAIEFARMGMDNEAFIIGGGDLFEQSIDLADRIYLSQIHATLPADVYFPEISSDDWQETKSEHFPADENNLYEFTFLILERWDNPL